METITGQKRTGVETAQRTGNGFIVVKLNDSSTATKPEGSRES